MVRDFKVSVFNGNNIEVVVLVAECRRSVNSEEGRTTKLNTNISGVES